MSCRIEDINGETYVSNSDGSPSELYEEALRYYGNVEDAISAYTTVFTDEFQNEVGINTDVATLKDVTKFLSNRSVEGVLNGGEIADVIAFMRANDIANLNELSIKLNNIFKKGGSYEVNTKRAIESKLFTEKEIDEMDFGAMLNKVNKVTSTSDNIDIEVSTTTPVSLNVKLENGEKGFLGNYRNLDVRDVINYVVRNSKSDSNYDIKQALLVSDYSYLADRVDDSADLRSVLKKAIATKRIVNKAFIGQGGRLITDNVGERKVVKNTILNSSTVEVEESFDYLNSVNEQVWDESIENIRGVIKGIEKDLIKHNIDVIGLHNKAEDRASVLHTLLSVVNMMQNPTSEAAIDDFLINRGAIIENTQESEAVIERQQKLEGLNILHIETSLSDAEMFDRHGLVKVGDSLYHQTNIDTDIAYDNLYERFVRGEFVIPSDYLNVEDPFDIANRTEVIEAIKEYVKGRDTGIKANNYENVSLAQVIFGYGKYEGNRPTNFNVENHEYLQTDFVSDFYQYILEEKLKNSVVYNDVLKHFNISDTDINLEAGIFTPDIRGIKYEKELRNYASLKKEGNIKQLYKGGETAVSEDIMVMNGIKDVHSIQGKSFNIEGDYLITPSSPDIYKRVGDTIYRKVLSNGLNDTYQKINIPNNNTYFNYDLNFSTEVEQANRISNLAGLKTDGVQNSEDLENNTGVKRQLTPTPTTVSERTITQETIESLTEDELILLEDELGVDVGIKTTVQRGIISQNIQTLDTMFGEGDASYKTSKEYQKNSESMVKVSKLFSENENVDDKFNDCSI